MGSRGSAPRFPMYFFDSFPQNGMDMRAVINRQRFTLAITRVLDLAPLFIDGVDLAAVEIRIYFRLLNELRGDPALGEDNRCNESQSKTFDNYNAKSER